MIALVRGASILLIFAIAGFAAEINNTNNSKEKDRSLQEIPAQP